MIDKKRELFFFIVSGIAHAVFFYWLLNAHLDVKVFIPQEEIAEVVIVSSGQLRPPILPNAKPSSKHNQSIPGPESPQTPNPNAGEFSSNATTPDPSLPKEFATEKLNLQVLTRQEDPFSVNLDLSLKNQPDSENNYKKILKDLETEEGTPIYNLSRHLTAGGMPGQTNSAPHQMSSGNSKGYFNIKHFDIKPWSQRVISRINNQWSIPLAIKVGATGVVGVKTTFKKNGEIAAVSIEQQSGLASLDQSALAAVVNSAPFPSLPKDFPYETLEAYFVFEYGT